MTRVAMDRPANSLGFVGRLPFFSPCFWPPGNDLKSLVSDKKWKKDEFYVVPLLHRLIAHCTFVPCIAHRVCLTLITILVVLFLC